MGKHGWKTGPCKIDVWDTMIDKGLWDKPNEAFHVKKGIEKRARFEIENKKYLQTNVEVSKNLQIFVESFWNEGKYPRTDVVIRKILQIFVERSNDKNKKQAFKSSNSNQYLAIKASGRDQVDRKSSVIIDRLYNQQLIRGPIEKKIHV